MNTPVTSRICILVASLTAAIPLLSPDVSRADDLADGTKAWEEKDYEAAYTLFARHREAHGKSPDVDYMLGTAACQILAHRAYGADLLDKMLVEYQLSAERRRTVASERDKCKAALTVNADVRQPARKQSGGALGGGGGFSGHLRIRTRVPEP